MKKLMIILLVGMLTLGLSGVAFADPTDDQLINGEITTAVAINTAAADLTSETLTAGVTWTDGTCFILIDANCPYDLDVRVSTVEEPTGETTVDNKMTANNSAFTDLGAEFQIKYDGGATSNDDTISSLTNITTSGDTFVSCPENPAGGDDQLEILYSQVIAAFTDPSYNVEGTQLTYSIKLLWTVSVDITP